MNKLSIYLLSTNKECELEIHLGIGLSEAYAKGAFDVRYNVCQGYFGGTFLKINTTAPTQKKSKT